ncbi:transglycosylase domain-containing protein [Micromonospora sp. WMMD882]|uniref:transglycosylase domain-containing protein n=1 Tax=Micromonospora sp. WMMD882 TaxID=3015151 RepID=UPI00248BAE07|nr:transglycosylase domain-containing protein [Micromonospora sp. WMMD882]WBB78340.1 transglycosylase domain-containing protein [Micromonospora sp. WMMD882]
MNSYGDPSSPRGRARIPGSDGDPGAGADDAYRRPAEDDRGTGWSSGYDGATPAGRATPTPRAPGSSGRASVAGSASVPPRGGMAPPISPPPSGSASVGRAGAGRASVPVPPAGGGRASVPVSPAGGRAQVGGVGPSGRASVGGQPSGRASVGAGSSGRASVGAASPVSPAGRASVGAASVGAASVGGPAGRATVARASVFPPGGADLDGRGPGGPTGPGRRSRANQDPEGRRRAKKRKRLNLIIASFAVFIMLAGIGVVGFTYYSAQVVLPNSLPLPFATTVYTSDGKGLVAKLGSENREFITINDIPPYVQRAVAAAEDRNFYEHSGVDYKGIARAAWNNFTGGTKQGASTITQQYARNAYENLKDDSYARKVKEAILASKLNDQYSKDEIMQHYLNTIYFGRGAYGVEAAAKAYFGKSAKNLDVAQAAALAGVIKQPQASDTHPGYDPTKGPEAAQAAQDRWNYVIGGMVEEGWLKPEERPAAFPKMNPEKANGFGVDSPRGNVVNYVRQEMAGWGLCTDTVEPVGEKPTCAKLLRTGGFRIRTTIDSRIQASAEVVARQKAKDSELSDQPKNLMAAVVSIDPKTGRVLAYYGGESGEDIDYAGKNTDSSGRLYGGHPPGSSFKVYTLAAALDAGISVKSHWDAKPFKPEGFANPVQNAGRDVSANGRCNRWCTLDESTVESYNVPFYHVSTKVGPDKIIDIAKRAGITTMWTTSDNPPKPVDLTKTDPKKVAPEPFFHVVGYGQYPVTVLDHANGLATLANEGKYNKAHFVLKMEKQDEDTGEWKTVPGTGENLGKGGQQLIKREVAREVTAVLKKIPGKNSRALDNGRDAAGKTGTWEYDSKDNAHAWMVGYTPQIATAVWVGSKDPKKPQILDKNGKDIGGSALPGAIWERYMNAATKGMEKRSLPDITGVGDVDAGNGVEPPPPPPVNPPPGQNPNPNPNPPCLDPLNILCRDNPPGGPGGGNPNDPNTPPPAGPGGPGGPGGGGGGVISPSPRITDRD